LVMIDGRTKSPHDSWTHKLGPLRKKVFRVGHMGNVNHNDLLATIAAIEGSLSERGHSFAAGAGVGAANHILASAT
jgi:aspartate aminotransferase-like enzyme